MNALPEWERELLNNQVADQARDAALRTGWAVLDAYDRGILPINAHYLADTLRMILNAVPPSGKIELFHLYGECYAEPALCSQHCNDPRNGDSSS